jgi:hypothetical protein
VSGFKPLVRARRGAALLAAPKPGDIAITPSSIARSAPLALDALDVLGKFKHGGVSLLMIDLGGDTTGNGVSKPVFAILLTVAEAEGDRTPERIAEGASAEGNALMPRGAGLIDQAHRRQIEPARPSNLDHLDSCSARR